MSYRKVLLIAAAAAIATQVGPAWAQFAPPVAVPPPVLPQPQQPPLTGAAIRPPSGPSLSDLPPAAPVRAQPASPPARAAAPAASRARP